jgi:hypothetical protein
MVPLHEGREHTPTGSSTPPVWFDAVTDLPGKWRKVRVDVTPEEVRAYWANSVADEPTQFATISAAGINNDFATHQTNFAAGKNGVGLVVTPWSPRMPLGIWCRRAAVSFRNIVVEPLPSP